MATITLLGDIIIPKDDRSGSASDAKVPEFIEFIVKDMPYHQVPIRGGLKWLDLQCLNRYNNAFKDVIQSNSWRSSTRSPILARPSPKWPREWHFSTVCGISLRPVSSVVRWEWMIWVCG
jgi:hypothetical protein